MRLFIAIQFSDQIRKVLAETMTDLRRQGVSGNFSRVENLHLTLAFLGEVKSPEQICRAMKQAAGEPFRLTLGTGGSFGDLYWVGLKESPELTDYVKDLRAKLQEEKIWFDPKAFKPHITIVRKARHEGKVQIRLRKASFPVTKISLMESARKDGKLIYTEMYAVDLKGKDSEKGDKYF